MLAGLLLLITSAWGQSSLWRDQSLYIDQHQSGDSVVIHVNEYFEFETKGGYEQSIESTYESHPDSTYFSMLASSQSSKTFSRSAKQDNQVGEFFEFKVAALLGANNNGLFQINGTKSITLDEKETVILISGLIDPVRIQKGMVVSNDIVNLNIIIRSAPTPPIAPLGLAGIGEEGEEGAEGEDQNREEAAGQDIKLSEEAQRRLQLQYMREILGSMK